VPCLKRKFGREAEGGIHRPYEAKPGAEWWLAGACRTRVGWGRKQLGARLIRAIRRATLAHACLSPYRGEDNRSTLLAAVRAKQLILQSIKILPAHPE
jgi:hypothetical protein